MLSLLFVIVMVGIVWVFIIFYIYNYFNNCYTYNFSKEDKLLYDKLCKPNENQICDLTHTLYLFHAELGNLQ